MNAYKAKPHIATLTLGQLQQLAQATGRFKGNLWN